MARKTKPKAQPISLPPPPWQGVPGGAGTGQWPGIVTTPPPVQPPPKKGR